MTEKAFKNFKEIQTLPSIEEKQKAWMKDYQGLSCSRAKNGNHFDKWATEPKIYVDDKFTPLINCIGRKKNRVVIEFDEVEGEPNNPKESFEKVKGKLKEEGWGFIHSTHGSKNSDYLWVEFKRDLTSVETKNFLAWICPEGGRIDLNFTSDKKVFPVLFATHWKYPMAHELPVEFIEGKKIDYDSLEIPNKQFSLREVNKNGFKYKTYSEVLANKKREEEVEPKYNLIWDDDLATHEIEEKEWLIDGLIPRSGIGVWTGRRATFKTFVVMSSAYCVSSGEKFLGQYETKKGKVIYLDKENGVSIMKERSRLIKTGLGLKDSKEIGFICYSDLKIDKAMHLLAIRELIEKEKPSLLVIDTYRRAISFDENSARDVSQLFVEGLKPIIEKYYPLTIILIHHDRKSSGHGDAMEEIRGSSDLANYCDFILKNERKGENIVLNQLKNRNAPELKPISIQVDTDETDFIRFTSTGEFISKKKLKKQVCSEALILWITENQILNFKTSDAKAITSGKGIGKSLFFEGLREMEEKGLIEKTIRGEYKVNQKKLGIFGQTSLVQKRSGLTPEKKEEKQGIPSQTSLVRSPIPKGMGTKRTNSVDSPPSPNGLNGLNGLSVETIKIKSKKKEEK